MFEDQSIDKAAPASRIRWWRRLFASLAVVLVLSAFALHLNATPSQAAAAGTGSDASLTASPDIFGCNTAVLSTSFLSSNFGFPIVGPFGTAFINPFVANPFGFPILTAIPCVTDCSQVNQLFTPFLVPCPGPPGAIELQGTQFDTCGSQSTFTAKVTSILGLLVADGTPVEFSVNGPGYVSRNDSTIRGLASTSLVIPTRTSGVTTLTARAGDVQTSMNVVIAC